MFTMLGGRLDSLLEKILVIRLGIGFMMKEKFGELPMVSMGTFFDQKIGKEEVSSGLNRENG